MIAIETRYIPATNTKPSRIKAYTCNGQSLVMSVGKAEELSPDRGNHADCTHRVVAQALADRMGWGPLGGCGGTKRGYAFVFDDKGE